MPGMPYHLEKGPLLSVLDSFCNTGPRQRLTTALGQLRNGASLPQIGVFDSPNLYSTAFQYPFRSRDELVAHFNDHWLGIPPDNDPSTGHWKFYKGPVEDIMRETLIRALEVALGVPHDKDKDPKPKRRWIIDFWWKCPQPWFEGWVTWRNPPQSKWVSWCPLSKGSGHVTVIFATPSDDGVVLRSPGTEATVVPDTVTDATEGSWLITAATHTEQDVTTTGYTPCGEVVLHTEWMSDVGQPVVTLSPKFGSGGARNLGHRYVGTR